MPPKANSTFRYLDYKYHVVTTFEDGGDVYVVLKYYGKRRQWWHYEVWSLFEYNLKVNAKRNL